MDWDFSAPAPACRFDRPCARLEGLRSGNSVMDWDFSAPAPACRLDRLPPRPRHAQPDGVREVRVGTDCSGWESILMALKFLNVPTRHCF